MRSGPQLRALVDTIKPSCTLPLILQASYVHFMLLISALKKEIFPTLPLIPQARYVHCMLLISALASSNSPMCKSTSHLATSCRTKTCKNSAQNYRAARVFGASLLISLSRSDVFNPCSCGKITLLAGN
jgi:hypothetical protein